MVKCTIKLIDITEEDEIIKIIKKYHEGKMNHRGIDDTEARIKQLLYWPKEHLSIQTCINSCKICQIIKYDRNSLRLKFNITPTAVKPFEISYIDRTTLDNAIFLTIVDSCSKYAQLYK